MIDTHAHIHESKFDGDRDAVLTRAREAGVHTIVTIGTDIADSRRAVDIAAVFDLFASIGIHPDEAVDAPADISTAFDSTSWNQAIAACGKR